MPKLSPTGTNSDQLEFANLLVFSGSSGELLVSGCVGIALITRGSCSPVAFPKVPWLQYPSYRPALQIEHYPSRSSTRSLHQESRFEPIILFSRDRLTTSAEEFLNSLADAAAVADLAKSQASESLHFESKRCSEPLSGADKEKLAKALSGFANSVNNSGVSSGVSWLCNSVRSVARGCARRRR
jgi:hypothetical protein